MDNVWTVAGIGVTQVGTIAALIVNIVATRRTGEQLKPNGGSTVADAVRRTDERVERIENRVDHVVERLDRHIDGGRK